MKVRNTNLVCTKCEFSAPELEWDEVWSHKHGGFIAGCCPKCKAVDTSCYNLNNYVEHPNEIVLYGLERIKHTLFVIAEGKTTKGEK